MAVARNAAATLLEELGVEAYLYSIEPGKDGWEITIECALAEGWEQVTMTTSLQQLEAAHTDEAIRLSLIQEWRNRLSACKLEPGR